MSGFTQAQDQVHVMVAQVKTLTVEKLKNLLRSEGLAVSGVKSELQIRTIAYIEKLRNASDFQGLNRVRGNIRGIPPGFNSTSSYAQPYSTHTPTSSSSPQFASPHTAYNMSNPFTPSRITFKNSPFYTIRKPLSQTFECKARENTRDTARVTVALSQTAVDQLASDPLCRIMVFCAAEGFAPFHRESDIAFPHNVELKCNGDEVKANLRGLKNRPGSTRPADITSLVRKKANYQNTVEMVYALTTKGKTAPQKFFLVVNLVTQKPIEAMVSELRTGRVISKEQVLKEMRHKAEDPDEIVATSSVLSLKDPVAYTRINTPCRGIGCNHNQCFDAASYLQLQEQAPTWTCPICNKPAPWEHLALDQYVNDILNSTSRNVEAVVIEPDGKWHLQRDGEGSNRTANPTPSDDDDDDEDLVELSERPERSLKMETLTPHSVRTPPLSSREESTVPLSASRSSNKRPRDVIDLTLSDDEENDDDARAPKTRRPLDDPLRTGPPSDRYQFQFPPVGSLPHNFDRLHTPF